MVKAIQELKEENDKLKVKVEVERKELTDLKSENSALKDRLELPLFRRVSL